MSQLYQLCELWKFDHNLTIMVVKYMDMFSFAQVLPVDTSQEAPCLKLKVTDQEVRDS